MPTPYTFDAGDNGQHTFSNIVLKTAGTPYTDTINIGQPSFFRGMDSLLVSIPTGAWRDYLRWHLVRQAAPWLSSPFVLNNFRYVQAVSGVMSEGSVALTPSWLT